MGIKAPARLGFDPSQREVDRSRQMVLAVLPRRQHVDNLRALRHEATNLFPIDLSYHRGLLIPWDRRGSEPRRVLSDQLTVPVEDPSAPGIPAPERPGPRISGTGQGLLRARADRPECDRDARTGPAAVTETTGTRRRRAEAVDMKPPTRGQLRIYLGFASGVGKTYALLSEGGRRAERGTDVVVACLETRGRPGTAALLKGLETIPRARTPFRGSFPGGDGPRRGTGPPARGRAGG
jgi:Osmosensitive K+ channel His kinase sensor domain